MRFSEQSKHQAGEEERGVDLFGMRNLSLPFIAKGLLLSTAETRSVLGCSVTSNSSQLHELQPARLLCPWDSLGKTTGVG